jgi:uncharacterized protein (DUF302 family)
MDRPVATRRGAVAAFTALVGIAMAASLVSFRSHPNTGPLEKTETSMTGAQPAGPAAATVAGSNGIASIPSHHSVDETVARLTGLLQAKGVTLFALVDHSGEAAKAGLSMPPTKLLIFGSPKAGTPVMLAAPSSAIDLPLKVLVAEDAAGKVSVSYNTPAYLQQRHGLPPDLLPNIAVVQVLAAKAAE